VIEHRGAARPNLYTLVTPANHYPSRLPEYGDQPVVKLVTPRFAPARIGQYLVVLSAGAAGTRPIAPGFDTFIYVLDGVAALGEAALPAGGYAYIPATEGYALAAGEGTARVLVVKRPPNPVAGLAPPGARTGHRDDEPFAATPVPGFTRRELLPVDDPAFSFAMSLLRFEAGVGLPNVEIHDEEHGLYVVAGEGEYLLGTDRHAVQAGDFIYMAPYCPQGFRAGAVAAEYLLYKDTWRDGF